LHLSTDLDAPDIQLRDAIPEDLPVFFLQQLEPDANHMAAFTRKDPSNQEAFNLHWAKLLRDESIQIKTIVFAGNIAGYVLKYELFGKPELGYWIGKEYWGQGIATQAVADFIVWLNIRPLHARAAKDNFASLRVLAKNGFEVCGEGSDFANARGEEIEETAWILR